jgi:hypothetical protein
MLNETYPASTTKGEEKVRPFSASTTTTKACLIPDNTERRRIHFPQTLLPSFESSSTL